MVVVAAAALLLPERYESTFSIQVEAPPAARDVPAAEVLRRAGAVATGGIDAEWTGGDVIGVACEGSSAVAAHDRCDLALSALRLHAPGQPLGTTPMADSLEKEAAGVRERLSATLDSLRSYERAQPATARPERTAADARERARTTTQRDELRAELATVSQLAADVERGRSGERAHLEISNYPASLRNDSVTRLLNALSELEGRRAELAVTRSVRNPDMAVVDQEIATVEQDLSTILVDHERSLTSRIRSMDTSLVSETEEVTVPARPATASRLEAKIAGLEDLDRRLQDQLREAGADALPTVRVLTEASVPSEPSFPGVVSLLIGGSLLALSLGAALAVHREKSDTRFRRPDEIEAATDLPVLGVLPSAHDSGPVLPIRPVLVRGLVPRGSQETSEKPVLREALDGLIAKLDIVGCDPKDGIFRSVAITGTRRGEGTTFVACNLALMSAARGRRTLLVDADLEAHGVVDFFRLSPSQPGLIDVLRGRAAMERACVGYRVADGDLNVLTAGNSFWGMEPDLLVFAFSEELNRAEHDYDTIIVDSPPQGLEGFAIPVAEAVDAILLVVGEGLTEREAVRDTLDRLEGSGGRVVGIVLNDPGAAE